MKKGKLPIVNEDVPLFGRFDEQLLKFQQKSFCGTVIFQNNQKTMLESEYFLLKKQYLQIHWWEVE